MLIPFGVFSAAGAGGAAAGAYELIQTAYGTGSSGVITFSSIPSTYKHIQVRYASRTTGTDNNLYIRFNSDTANNYAQHQLFGNGSTVISSANSTQNAGWGGWSSVNGDTANAFSGGIIDVLDYASTNKNKTMRSISGSASSGNNNIFFRSSLWQSTSAITTLTLELSNGAYPTSARFSLYGIKG